MRLKFIKKSQSKISHHEILFIRKFRGNIGKIKNYDYEKKSQKHRHTHTHTELHEMMAAPSFHFRSVL